MDHYAGNAREDGHTTGGWFVGHFIGRAEGIRSTSAFEAKWYTCASGDRRVAPVRPKEGMSMVLLVEGRLRIRFKDSDVLLWRPADYSLWQGPRAHTWTAEADSVVIAFRTPSIK